MPCRIYKLDSNFSLANLINKQNIVCTQPRVLILINLYFALQGEGEKFSA